ncbi:hypothetical protein [Streptomyces colonosanans]|uniref:Uncharacterized protein n=1 Tax=Streptomyces colonosanans TaxID=1428652 RepID=A0A1S2PR59_9ACTN|nr:hypothetical protein [Streptomyces colonosanans]OIJ95414.1 hypothetical protein BIV24_09025 [Streptomyces colonosanans]
MTTAPAEIRYCEHAARVIRIEAPAVTELVAAAAHLEKALAADPHDSAAYYAPQGMQHLVPAWIRDNADRLRQQLDALVTRYTDPGTGLISQAPAALDNWTDPATGRTWDLTADYFPTDDALRRPGVVWRYRGMHAAGGAPILHPHHLPERTPCPGSCWPINTVPTIPVRQA